jgi:hypothetical protein
MVYYQHDFIEADLDLLEKLRGNNMNIQPSSMSGLTNMSSQLIKVKGAEQTETPMQTQSAEAKQPSQSMPMQTDARSGASPAIYG